MKILKTLFGVKDPAPVPTATLKKDAGLYVLHLGGMVNKATIDRIQGILRKEIERGGEDLCALIVLNDFRGWRKGDNWDDIDFFAEHEAKFSKIATVGDAEWKSSMLTFFGAGRRTGEVRYFTTGQETEARVWLRS
jgi:hypothetical protein